MPRRTNYDLAQEALEHNLFINGWYMETLMQSTIRDADDKFRRNHTIYVILYDRKRKHIGCACYLTTEGSISLFIKPEFRGKGYGKILVERLLKKIRKKNTQVFAGYGEDGSEVFFAKLGIFTIDLQIYHFFEFTRRELAAINNESKTTQEIFMERFNKDKIAFSKNTNDTIDVSSFEYPTNAALIEKMQSSSPSKDTTPPKDKNSEETTDLHSVNSLELLH